MNRIEFIESNGMKINQSSSTDFSLPAFLPFAPFFSFSFEVDGRTDTLLVTASLHMTKIPELFIGISMGYEQQIAMFNLMLFLPVSF